MIDLTSSPQRPKRSRSSPSDFDHTRFKIFVAYHPYLTNFKNAPLVLERLVEQHTLSNILLATPTYLNTLPPKIGTILWVVLMKCMKVLWKSSKQMHLLMIMSSSVGWEVQHSPFIQSTLVSSSRSTGQSLGFPPIYDDLCPEIKFLRLNLGEDLKLSSTRSLVSTATFYLELKTLTLIMFSNLYLFTNTAYINLSRAVFLCDLMNDVEIDICHHIFHILVKITTRTASRNCLPFCSLVMKILKLKGVPLLEDESLLPKTQPINIRTYNSSKGHSSAYQKAPKHESGAPPSSSSQMDNLVDQIKELNTKMSKLISIMYA